MGNKIGIMTPETMHITALGSNYGGYFPRIIDQAEFLDSADFHFLISRRLTQTKKPLTKIHAERKSPEKIRVDLWLTWLSNLS